MPEPEQDYRPMVFCNGEFTFPVSFPVGTVTQVLKEWNETEQTMEVEITLDGQSYRHWLLERCPCALCRLRRWIRKHCART